MAMFFGRKASALVSKLVQPMRAAAFKPLSAASLSTDCDCNAEEVKKVTIIPGDGIGPELMHAMKEVFVAAQVPIEFEEFWVSEVHDRCEPELIKELIASVNRNKVAIKGHIATPTWFDLSELQSVNMNIRQTLDLFANVVRVQSFEGVKTRHDCIDIAVIREQTEGEYSSLEHEVSLVFI